MSKKNRRPEKRPSFLFPSWGLKFAWFLFFCGFGGIFYLGTLDDGQEEFSKLKSVPTPVIASVQPGGEEKIKPLSLQEQIKEKIKTLTAAPKEKKEVIVDKKTKKIVFILTGLGVNQEVFKYALESLPPGVMFSFLPYTNNLTAWISEAKKAGHDSLLSIPMEPEEYPAIDPGPLTLLTSFLTPQNLERLGWILQSGSHYIGVNTYMGSLFTTSRTALSPLFESIKERELIFVDLKTSSKRLAHSIAAEKDLLSFENNLFIDKVLTVKAIDQQLAVLKKLAETNGLAIGAGYAHPIVVERLSKWARTLEKKSKVKIVSLKTLVQKTKDKK